MQHTSTITVRATMEAIFIYLLLISLTSLALTKLLFFSNKNKHPSLPPTPPSLPFIGHLHLISTPPLHRSLARISSRYGPLVHLRFGSRPVLLVSSHTLAVECLTKNDLAFASRPLLPSTKLMSYNYTSLAAAPYGPYWRNIRKLATASLLSSSRLNTLYEVRRDEACRLLSNLFQEHRVDQSSGSQFKRVQLKPKMYILTLNMIVRTLLGKQYYGVLEGKDSEEAKSFRDMVEDSPTLVSVSNVLDFLPALRWVQDFRGVGKKVQRIVKVREEVLQGIIDERRGGRDDGGEKKSFLEVMLALQKEDPDYYTDETIKALIMTLLVAGSDTTKETMQWAMSRIINHQEVLCKVKSEINAHIGKDRLVEEHDLPNLPYLQGIINETLRMHPTAPVLIPHESLEECTVRGYTIPRGTILIVNVWAIHKDSETWKDPTEFKPERFMDIGGNRKENGLGFGMGRRKCPGEGLAIRVIGLVLANMIHCFEWEKIGKEVDMEERCGGITLCKAIPLEVMYRPDPAMINVLSQLRPHFEFEEKV